MVHNHTTIKLLVGKKEGGEKGEPFQSWLKAD
jgi:hypothetical protein